MSIGRDSNGPVWNSREPEPGVKLDRKIKYRQGATSMCTVLEEEEKG